MASDGGIAGWVARLHPALALLVVIGGIVLGRIAGIAVAILIEPDAFAPTSILSVIIGAAVMAVFVIGYPAAIAIHLLRTHGPVTQVGPMGIAKALLVMVPAFVIAAVGFFEPGPGGPLAGILQIGAILAGLAGVVHILWTAARGLVQAEDGRAVAFNRVIGTFFMFYFLPFGIYFLQRRVRRLEAGGQAPQAA